MLREATGRLRERVGDRSGARVEAEVLLAHVLGIERSALVARSSLLDEQAQRFLELVRVRVETGRPVAYLVGRRGFRDLEVFVDERVLVPRPETEHVVEVLLALQAGGKLPEGPVVDRGTGSGILALALASQLKGPLIGVDLSAEALEVAALNVRTCGAASGGSVALVRADCLSCFADHCLAAVLANPPYIAEQEFAGLPDDVRVHEPRMALVPAGGSPAAHYAALIEQAARVLLPGGWLVTEVGDGQAERVAGQMRAAGWNHIAVTQDLAGIGRVVHGQSG